MENPHGCPSCGRVGDTYFRTVYGDMVCGFCGTKLAPLVPPPPSLALNRRLEALENGACRLSDRIAALEDKASHYHHIPVEGTGSWGGVIDRIAELERRMLNAENKRGRR